MEILMNAHSFAAFVDSTVIIHSALHSAYCIAILRISNARMTMTIAMQLNRMAIIMSLMFFLILPHTTHTLTNHAMSPLLFADMLSCMDYT